MPLDFVTKPDLLDTVRWLGVTPVPKQVLEDHKRMEVAKHPPSRLHAHINKIRLGMLAVVLSCLALGLTGLAPFFIFIPAALLLAVDRWQIKGPARWREDAYSNQFIPTEIAKRAFALRAAIPGSFLVIGILEQNSVALDPYLLLCGAGTNEEVCLGVWDGETIIHQATDVLES